MAESLIEGEEVPAITEEAVNESISCGSGGIFSIVINSNINAQMVRDLCITDQRLSGIDNGYQLLARKINAAISKSFGGERDDQEIQETPGSLNVRLRCFTDQRFLEVLEEYESGRMKVCLLKEFLEIGIELEGLNVGLENIEEVETRKAMINKRLSLSPLDRKCSLASHRSHFNKKEQRYNSVVFTL